MRLSLLLCLLLFANFEASAASLADTTVIRTSFESNDIPPYPVGSIHGRNNWTVTAAAAEVTTDSAFARFATQGLKITASGSALSAQFTPFSGSVAGVSGIVYFDMYMKILSSATRELTVNGYDLFASSLKRTFVFEFSVPQNDTGSVRAYDGSARARIAKYRVNTWVRISGKVDYAKALYQILVDGSPAQTCAFRETYTPTASGTRQAGIKEFHQLLINFGSAANTGSVLAAMDSLYIGKTPLHNIQFPEPVVNYTVSVIQPAAGKITLNPSGTVFQGGTIVKATLSLPPGYRNYGWTGSLSGLDSVKTFTVNGNMTFSANVWIDSLQPPSKYTVSVTQPIAGTIAVSPYFPLVYAGLRDTAVLTLPSGYTLVRWTGALSGTGLVKVFTVDSNMTIGAEVVRDSGSTPGGSRKLFTTAASFKTALASANPGDTLELADGSYDAGGMTMTRSGTEQLPILLRARNRGAVELKGSSYFNLRGTWFVTIEGFVFTGSPSSAIKLESCKYTRVTRNVFRLNETTSSKWVYIGGTWNQPDSSSHHNRIDHNLFEEKHQLGNMITVDGSSDPTNLSSQYDIIAFNHFRNVGPRATNEMETIRLGWTGISASSGFGIVEYNLFENCDGDPEIISVKTNDNIIRYNTFVACQGTVCLRQTNFSAIEGNFFFGNGKAGAGGIRVYGKAHRIFNNYFSGLTGASWDAAITLTNGDADTNTTSLSSHIRPVRNIVAFNTLVGNISNIEIGFTNNGSYTKPPKDNVFAANLVTGSNGALIKYLTQPVNNVWEKNIMFPQGSASLGISAQPQEILLTDTKLALEDSLWRLSAASPAVNYAGTIHPFVSSDFDGQARDAAKDVGCDEYSQMPKLRRPLKPSDVGPNSAENPLNTEPNPAMSVVPFYQLLRQNYPNPFNPVTTIRYTVPAAEAADGAASVKLSVYDIMGRLIAALVNSRQNNGEYEATFDAASLPSGTYFYELRINANRESRKMILLR